MSVMPPSKSLEELNAEMKKHREALAVLKEKEKEEKRRIHYEAMQKEMKEREEFRTRLEREHGFVGHPKASTLFQLAWSHGHSAGLSEVELYYNEFAELLDPVEEEPKRFGISGGVRRDT